MTSTVTITYDSSNTAAIEAIRSIRKIECLKVSRAVRVKSDKEAILEEMRQSRREAEQIMSDGRKGHTIEEILGTI
ncbi:MAG: hypothetical protein KBT67_11250 [bacterium]|nr:hypothetical protein [Candidatus Limimorpha caballi]